MKGSTYAKSLYMHSDVVRLMLKLYDQSNAVVDCSLSFLEHCTVHVKSFSFMEIPKHHYIQQYLSINTIINIKYTCTTILTGNPTKCLLENKLFIYQTKWNFPK